MHLLIIREPPTICCLLFGLMTCCPFRMPINAGDFRAESLSIRSSGSFLSSVRHSDCERSKNVKLTHVACTHSSGKLLHLSISTNRFRWTAGLGAPMQSPARANSVAACPTALVLQLRICVSRMQAFPRCGNSYQLRNMPTTPVPPLPMVESVVGP